VLLSEDVGVVARSGREINRSWTSRHRLWQYQISDWPYSGQRSM